MNKTTNRDVPKFRARWLRRALRALVILAVLIAVPLVLELTRWNSLPEGPLPRVVSGPARDSRAGANATGVVFAWLDDRPITGVTVCVALEGEIRWCTAAGYADLAARRPLEATTTMRIGSVSKTVSSILLARLDEQGLVEIDRPIGEVMGSGLPPHLSAITLRQLASHTGGIRHYNWRFKLPPHETYSRRRYTSVDESLEQFVSDELVSDPGTGFLYSTHGYTLLGAVLEIATGRTFGALLEQEIVRPRGLSSTALENSPVPEQNLARPYEVVGHRYRDALQVDNSRAWPGGGILSSARDLARLASGLPQGQTVRVDTLERYLEPQTLPDGSDNPQRYALGWRIAQTSEFLGGRDSYRVAHHGGVSSGGSTFLALFPDYSVSVAVITNTRTGSGALIDLAFDVAEPFMADLVDGEASTGISR
ncbi:MAG: serine hydrolase [Acidobacteria bacterium]|nr:serine hydrolase [Acidobacteriota bacterium]